MQKISLLSLFVVCVASSSAFGEQPYAMPFGHDTSTTSYTLHGGECTAGLQTVACGVSNYFSLGTSPWLFDEYNMVNFLARLRLRTSETSQDTIQVGYFKTYETVNHAAQADYQMDLTWFYFVRTLFLTPDAAVHLNAQAMYFRDDKRPFSLRRPWLDRRPVQLNATALTELHVIGGWYINAELGILGLIQSSPEYLFAVTFEYRLRNWLFHGGISQLGTYEAFWHPLRRIDHQQYRRTVDGGFNGPLFSSMAEYDYSIHPEFALQYYF